MPPTMRTQWAEKPAVAAFHAAEACFFQRAFADQRLADALAGPVEALRERLNVDKLAAVPFFDYLVPLSATMGTYELAKIVLSKFMGDELRFIVEHWRTIFSHINNAYRSAAPPSGNLVQLAAPLRQEWDLHSPGLLSAVVRWTDKNILPDEASVVVMPPILGGAAKGHPRNKLACIEVLEGNPVADLPEVVRLTWAVSGLNLNLPVYSENVRANRLPIVAPLAMIPVALSAAAHLELAPITDETMTRAVEAWIGPGPEERAQQLIQWWETYKAMRPPWGRALQGLDLLVP
jgi:hypothetical protein